MSTKVTLPDKIIASTVLRLIPRAITPNQITVFRIITTPFVGWLLCTEQYLAGTVLFFISAFSDAMDGTLARTTNRITKWGKLYDPLADKLLIGVVTVVVVSKFLSFYLAFTIILLDVFIIIGAYFYQKRFPGIEIQANWVGKMKMILQSLGIGILLLGVVIGSPALIIVSKYVLYVAVTHALLSLLIYRSI